MTDLAERRYRCPTCGADQVLSSVCRRCKCDLQLVVDWQREMVALQQRTLAAFRAGDFRQGLAVAVERFELSPDSVARRLLSIAYLGLGEYSLAARYSRPGPEGRRDLPEP